MVDGLWVAAILAFLIPVVFHILIMQGVSMKWIILVLVGLFLVDWVIGFGVNQLISWVNLHRKIVLEAIIFLVSIGVFLWRKYGNKDDEYEDDEIKWIGMDENVNSLGETDDNKRDMLR